MRRFSGTIPFVEDEKTTTLMLEALFDIEVAVFEIREELLGDDDEGEEEDA